MNKRQKNCCCVTESYFLEVTHSTVGTMSKIVVNKKRNILGKECIHLSDLQLYTDQDHDVHRTDICV